MRNLVTLSMGIMFILSGIFRWYIVLSIFTWRIKPKNKGDVWLIRIISIIIGVCLVMLALNI